MGKNRWGKRFGWVLYAIIACVLLAALIPRDPLTFKDFEFSDVLQLLTLLILISLFLERALEVFVTTWRSPEKEQLEADVDRCKAKLTQFKDLSATEQAEDETCQAANLQLDNAKALLAAYKSRTRAGTLQAALVFGFLVSLVGVRALEGLIQIQAADTPFGLFQNYLFRILDVGLTGGLISGGSEGIHKVMQVFTTFLDATTRQAKTMAEGNPSNPAQ